MKHPIPLRRYLSIQLAMVAALPVAIVVILVWLFILPQMRTSIVIRHKTLSRTIAGQVSAHLMGGENQLVALADYMMAESPFPATQLTALLDANCGEGYLFETIYTTAHRQWRIDNVGLARARRPERIDLIGLDLSGRGFLFRTQPHKKAVWSQTFLSTVSSYMAVALTVPLADGVVIGEITLTKLSGFISHLPVEEGLFAVVLDRQGRIVADSKRMREGQFFNLAILPKVDSQDPSRFDTFKIDGHDWVGEMAMIEALGWHVLVAQPHASALRPLRDAFTLIAVGFALAMIITLALAWYRAGSLSTLVRCYGSLAQSIARGDYALSWPPATTLEFQYLADNLGSMAQTIHQREEQLVASEKQIKGVIANVPGAVYQLRATRDHVYSNIFISENTMEIFGLAADSQTIFTEFYKHIPDDEKDYYNRSIRDAVDDFKPWIYEGRFIKSDGETIWFSSNAIPYMTGDVIDFYGVLLNISDRKKMESFLRLTQFCFDKASVGIYRIADNGRILDVNEQACRSLGYSREELCRLTIFDIDPDYSPQRYGDLMRRLRNIRAHMIETRHRRKNGEIFPVQIRLNLTQYEDQEFIVAFEEDITERKRWQRQLEESERRYRRLFDEAPMMYVVTDAERDEPYIQNANNMFLETLGYRREDVAGTPISRYYTEDSKKKLFSTNGFQKALSGGFVSAERELVTLDNQIVHTLLHALPDYDSDGKLTSIRAMFLDITERKHALEQIQQLRNYLSNIIDSMPSVLVGVDAHLRVTQWNKQAESATGILYAKAISKPLSDVYPGLLKKAQRINAAIENHRVIRLPKIVSQVEGTRRFEDVTIFPVVGDGMEGAVIRVDDVTDQVRIEEMMIQSEKILSVGGLAAGMAHEINNPLAGILQNTAVLKNRLTGDLPANHKAAQTAGTTMMAIQSYMQQRNLPTMLENISTSGIRAATIVKNMLSFSRKSDRMVSSHDLAALLDQTLELAQTDYDMKKRYDFKQIRIVREYDPAAPPIPCESSKLQQVFLNILKNGAEAMAGADGQTRSPTFILRVKNESERLRVEIEDNGPGMNDVTRRRVFEPFFTTKPVGKGTGLGLSVSYFIVTENHGGKMEAQSVDGGGTRFVIRLPK